MMAKRKIKELLEIVKDKPELFFEGKGLNAWFFLCFHNGYITYGEYYKLHSKFLNGGLGTNVKDDKESCLKFITEYLSK